ncbi:four-carbon acid sugar kinase family protein [Mesorhizobium sp. B3-2-1]|uniref:3-oxo-tetronate kinase n=1 Tax=Mesorhizobium sp. B3-2-1 TaxID=2589891 RepID=UPI00112A7C5D|nr:3-oxo-tetronate kinase [Mesorhizobium sp. B3-2-1]TPI28328.1 four-carbon acid sugar kinase family protein [Mesorhizobium sp. B3-2-1]
MKIGVIGDDFTGAGDIANTLAKVGARTVQYVGTPTGRLKTEIDAAVIALKTRSIDAGDAVTQSLAACRWLIANGAKQIVFKYCSTFDSTPQGNIGPVAEALLVELDTVLALVCPAFPANRRTLYNGHLFVGDRLLSESGMENHPLTPMTDPDIKRWLARQTALKVGHLSLESLRSGNAQAALRLAKHNDERLIVADAISDDDLLALGRIVRTHRLVTGGSGIAMGLPCNFGIQPAMDRQPFTGSDGPGLILSGSCSSATRRQIAAYDSGHPSKRLDAANALDPGAALASCLDFLVSHKDTGPLVYSTAEPSEVAAAQAQYGRERLAASFDTIFAELAIKAVAAGFRRIVVAGGETSGAVASAFGAAALEVGPEIDTGVPVLILDANPRLAFALKSGNFGADDFFERALATLKGRAS